MHHHVPLCHMGPPYLLESTYLDIVPVVNLQYVMIWISRAVYKVHSFHSLPLIFRAELILVDVKS